MYQKVFTCHATKRKYRIRGLLTCKTKNIIYIIKNSKQYIGSLTGFEERFRIHTVRLGVDPYRDINTVRLGLE